MNRHLNNEGQDYKRHYVKGRVTVGGGIKEGEYS
jgi:hypothetical protein